MAKEVILIVDDNPINLASLKFHELVAYFCGDIFLVFGKQS